jgi:signal transduction histidine kinase
MMRHLALAPLRGLALFGLSLVGCTQFVVAFFLSFTGVVAHFERERWLPALCRRLMRAWLGVEIPEPYRPRPQLPKPDSDGWYREGAQLYREARSVARVQRYNWLLKDPATHRDHLWALLTPVTGGLIAALPAGLIVLAFLVPLVAAIPLVLLGFAIGPTALWIYGRWTGALLGPSGRTGRSPVWRWVMAQVWAALRLGATAGLSLVSLFLAVLHLLAIFPGLVAPMAPLVRLSRPWVNIRRRQIGRWSGVPIAEPYLPPPAPPIPRPDGKYQVGRQLHDSPRLLEINQAVCATVKDKATWRDLAWLLLDPVVAVVLAVVPVVLGVTGFFVFFWSWVWSLPINLIIDMDLRAGWAYVDNLIPGLEGVPHWVTPVAGLAMTAVALFGSHLLFQAHSRWSGLLLAPTQSALLALRVSHLTKSRADATDTQAAELRRIERDLHDGAQARWVAMGLNLGAVERLMDQDPDAARKLLVAARNSSAEALVELRNLVRGIHPPVLSERGLGDAIRALALDSALDVHVAVDLSGRVPAPVEAAVYFAVNELLTNSAKHGKAQRASIDIRYYEGRLRVTVSDDGRGGADPALGGGLQGIQRRLATFDGELSLNSPLEVPCALFSPRTSPSSGTA